jgi:hypothetical protein
MNDTPAAIWLTTAYRIQPTGKYIEIGDEVLCFRNLVDAYAYVETWYGDNCTLYEVYGVACGDGEEDFQTDYQEREDEEYQTIHMIPTVRIKVKEVKTLGGFSYDQTFEEGCKTVRWRYTAL